MAKYGLFRTGGLQPLQEYEGDYLKQDKQFVEVWKNSRNQNEGDQRVAAIHLDKGESIKKIAD